MSVAAIAHVSDLLPDLATDLPGCAGADKLAELERAARELCDRSRVWRTRVTVEAEADALTAALDAAVYGARVIDLDRVLVDGAQAWPFMLNDKPRLALDAAGAQYVTFEAAPVAGAAYDVTLDLTLKPGPLALAPAWLLTEYGDAVAARALSRLKRHARKPYTDYDGAEAAEREWRRGVARAAQDGAARLAAIDATGVVPAATEWTVGAGTALRTFAGDNPTYADLVKAVRTLLEDLQTRGVI